eukprot:Blabericola_migrator_1__4258@NODE_2303_length_2973_cov_32_539573_g1442_i0_p2_GENE_NODE_2303_length_2973_cov_32_539573_g1442_i0NODE_2303_length_2973_cov_32_539573_g1442_i0_p2_ORF_typecomplete_len101_score19_35_NODE_2303_length_2973_cov_32_539573_g1442_i0147449
MRSNAGESKWFGVKGALKPRIEDKYDGTVREIQDGSLVWDGRSTLVENVILQLSTETSVDKMGSTVLELDERERLFEVFVKSIKTVSSSGEESSKSMRRT